MTRDPIVEEVRTARQEIFAACNEDLDALLDRLQEQEERDRERLVFDVPAPPQQHTRKPNRVRP